MLHQTGEQENPIGIPVCYFHTRSPSMTKQWDINHS
jgi:hypothetical protein